MLQSLIFLAKIGNDYFNYQYIGDKISLLELNKNPLIEKYPVLNNDDYEMLKNSGGTLIYRELDPERFIWLININHKQLEFFNGSPLSEKIYSIIESIKRDITLNKVL